MTEADKQALDNRLMQQNELDKSHNDEKIAEQIKDKKPLWLDSEQPQATLEKRYQQAIAADPENKKNYAYLAGLYLKNNKTARAIEAYQDAISMDPENPKLFAAISIAYLHQGQYEMARVMAGEALRLDPKLQQVEKINQYISAKQAALKAAANVNTKSQHGYAPHTGMRPSSSALLNKTNGKSPHSEVK